MSLTASAQMPLSVRSQQAIKTGMKARSGDTRIADRKTDASLSTNALHKTRPAVTARVMEAGEAENPYGPEVIVMYEDFSKLATGEFGAPDFGTKLNYDECEYPWWNMNAEFTDLPNWGCNNAYSAGGMIYLNSIPNGASVNTPLLDVSGNCGIAVFRFRARTESGTAEGLIVEAAETFNMSPTWDILGGAELPAVTDEWQTYEITFYGGGKYTIFNIVMYPTAPVYIDDVTVYQIDQYVDTPVTRPHSAYTGKSFDANWEAVDGADGYLLDVYTEDIYGDRDYLLQDQKVQGTSYTVEDITSGETYYYTLRATKGDKQSMVTLPVEVFDLEAPQLEDVEEVVDGKYTASWNEVPSAERYNYWAYNVRKADADGEFVVTDENFDGIKDPDGNLTGLTIDDENYYSYTEVYLKDLSQAGWRGLNYWPYTDFICVDGWQYLSGQGDAGLVSPDLDLSKDDGRVSLSVKLYGEIDNMWDEYDNPIPTQTECAIALFNYDEAVGDYVQAELIYPEGVAEEWKNFNVTLTKGTSRSVIGIYAVRAPGHLYIDDLKITQNYKKGESLTEPFLFAQWHESTSIDVTLPAKIVESPVYHKVSAVKSDQNAYGDVRYKESKFSDLKLVSESASASVGENMLRENTDAPVEYYNLQGLRVSEPVSGLCIRRQGNQVNKVFVK